MSDYYELSANNEQEFSEKLKKLVVTVQNRKPNISKIRSFGEYISFIRDFENEMQTDRPISISDDDAIDPAHLEILKKYNYPEDYIEWATKYGNYSLWIESARIASLSTVIEEIEDYYSFLAANNYFYFTTDGGGNMFGFDQNEPGYNIRFFDHNNYVSEDSIEDIYSEVYDFYYDDEEEEYENPEELDIAQIFDAEEDYIQDSVYIKQYLKRPDVSKTVPAESFLAFLLLKTEEGFNNILDRYYNEIEKTGNELIGSGAFEEGIVFCGAMIDARPEWSPVHHNRADKYRKAGLYNEALKDIRKAIELDDTNEDYYALLAEILFELGDENGFFESLENALENGFKPGLIDKSIAEHYAGNEQFRDLIATYS